MKRFFSLFEGRRFTTARRREVMFTDERMRHDPFDRALTSPRRRFRDSWLPQEKELTPQEEEKKNHKENADFVYEGGPGFNGQGAINPADGEPVDYFLDIKGESTLNVWATGDGDDVVYHQGGGWIWTKGGGDIVYFTEGLDEGLGQDVWACQVAYLGEGDDKVFGGKGSQYANGGPGDDYFDLGDGHDMAFGNMGADEFVIDLQNTGTDIILDFCDVGDKITVKNGGDLAQDGDWVLAKASSFDGPGFNISSYIDFQDSLAKEQDFYEIRNADNGIAAVFGIGTRQSSAGGNPGRFSLTASIDSSGIEISASEFIQWEDTSQGSIEFA